MFQPEELSLWNVRRNRIRSRHLSSRTYRRPTHRRGRRLCTSSAWCTNSMTDPEAATPPAESPPPNSASPSHLLREAISLAFVLGSSLALAALERHGVLPWQAYPSSLALLALSIWHGWRFHVDFQFSSAAGGPTRVCLALRRGAGSDSLVVGLCTLKSYHNAEQSSWSMLHLVLLVPLSGGILFRGLLLDHLHRGFGHRRGCALQPAVCRAPRAAGRRLRGGRLLAGRLRAGCQDLGAGLRRFPACRLEWTLAESTSSAIPRRDGNGRLSRPGLSPRLESRRRWACGGDRAVISLDDHLQARPCSIAEQRGGKTLLVWGELGQWLVVDAEAAALIEQFDRRRRVGDVLEAVARAAGKSVQATAAEAMSLLESLVERGIVGETLALPPPPKDPLRIANLTFNITDRCNLRCAWCYNVASGGAEIPVADFLGWMAAGGGAGARCRAFDPWRRAVSRRNAC